MADGEGDGGVRQYDRQYNNHREYNTPSPPLRNREAPYRRPENGNNSYSDDSMDDHQDAPLDFSVRSAPKSSDSRSNPNTDDIPKQNLNNKLSNGLHRMASQEYKPRFHSREYYNHEQHDKSGNNPEELPVERERIKTECISPPPLPPPPPQSQSQSQPPPVSPRANGLSPGSNGVKSSQGSEQRIGEPKLAVPGMFPGALLPGGRNGEAGLFPMFPAGMLPNAAGLMNGLPLPQEVTHGKHGQNGKSVRPFKAFTKDQLNLPPPFGAMTGLPQISGLDFATAQAMAASSEEMFAQYRNYMVALQDQMRGERSPSDSSISSGQGHESSGSRSGINSPPQSIPSSTPLQPSIPSSPPQNGLTSPSLPLLNRSPYAPRPPTQTRKRGQSLPDEQKDDNYWERRRKNNEAAKRSRDSRRAKEDEIAIRAAFLEQENLKLRVEVAALKNETTKLRCMLYNS